jgi:hypothetical protein
MGDQLQDMCALLSISIVNLCFFLPEQLVWQGSRNNVAGTVVCGNAQALGNLFQV